MRNYELTLFWKSENAFKILSIYVYIDIYIYINIFLNTERAVKFAD